MEVCETIIIVESVCPAGTFIKMKLLLLLSLLATGNNVSASTSKQYIYPAVIVWK